MIAEYIVGDASDQSLGLDTVTVCVTVAVFPAATEVAGDEAAPTPVPVASPDRARHRDRLGAGRVVLDGHGDVHGGARCSRPAGVVTAAPV